MSECPLLDALCRQRAVLREELRRLHWVLRNTSPVAQSDIDRANEIYGILKGTTR